MTDQLTRAFADSSAPALPPVKPGLLKRFNPYDFDGDQVRRQATGRGPLLRRILAAIHDNARRREPPNQHLLVLGPRGMGKSFLVRWVQVEIEAPVAADVDGPAEPPVRFVRLSEEQLNVSAPELLLDEIRRVLEGRPANAVRVRWQAGGAAEWSASLEALQAAIKALPGFAEGGGLVVVSIENFDLLLEEVFADPAAQSRLRALLAAEPRLMLLATATKPADEDADRRLFQAFERLHLQPWRPDDFVAFYRRAFRGGLTVTAAVEAKIRALAHFLGGSPRLAVLMGDILHSNDALSAVDTLDQLVDELTPYYQDRILNRLKKKSRWLLDEMLRGGEPCSQSDLAQRIGAGQSGIAQDFRALLRDQVVVGHRETGGRQGLYRVADRVFAHFYRKRYLAHDSHSPLAAMVDFLESFYTQQELVEQVQRLTQDGELAKAEILTRALWQGADWHGADRGSRRRVCRRLIGDLIEVLGTGCNPPLAEALRGLDALLRDNEPARALHESEQALGLALTPAERVAAGIAQGVTFTVLPADDEALARLKTVVADTAQTGQGALYVLALEALAIAEAYTGNASAADGHFQHAADEAVSIGDRRRLAWVLYEQLWHFLHTKRCDAFDDAFPAAVDAASASGQKALLARILGQRGHFGYCGWQRKDFDAQLASVEKAVDLAREAGDDATLSWAAVNYSVVLLHFIRYDDALAATGLAQQAAVRAGDDDLALDAAWGGLTVLGAAERHQALIDQAPAVIAMAQRLSDVEGQARIQWLLSNAYEAVGERQSAIDTLWKAAELAGRGKNTDLCSNVRENLILRLAMDRRAHADDIVDAYLFWIDRVPPAIGKDGIAASALSYRPRWQFDELAAAATVAGRWPEVIEFLGRWEQAHPGALRSLPANSGAAADAVADLSATDGLAPAFSAGAGLLRAVGAVLTATDTAPALAIFLRELVGTCCTRFIARLTEPNLLRDLAQEVRVHLGQEDIGRGLEAAALYHAQGARPQALERVDPDIREAVSALLGIAADAAETTREASFAGAGFPRADARVPADERAAIAARLGQPGVPWPTPPLYPADWTDAAPEQATDLVVAILGAARRAADDGAGDLFLALIADQKRFDLVTARALRDTRAVRITEPPFYPGWVLVECCVPRPAGQGSGDALATLSCLVGEVAVVPITGVSPPIHELNARSTLALTDPQVTAAYLHFFCNCVRGEDSPFRLIESLDQLPLTRQLEPDETAKLAERIRPIRAEPHTDGSWTTRALVQYGGGLYEAGFLIQPWGMVEMTDYEPPLIIDGIRRERMASGLRWFDGVYPAPDEDAD